VIDELYEMHGDPAMNFGNKTAYGKRLSSAELFIISDLDGTLIEGEDTSGLKEFTEWINQNRERVVFGIASGRNREITEEAFAVYSLPKPDILICSAGSEIYYTEHFIPDKGWESHIDFQWKREELVEVLSKFPGIRMQESNAQWPFKLSYYVDEDFNSDRLADLHKYLDDNKLRAKVFLTQNKYLDFLPIRAGKGNAIRYLSYKWRVPMQGFITAGNSGNDRDMLSGKTKGIVVANYSPEMEELKRNKFVYFTKHPLSLGVLEGINYHLDSE
jgi:sucrose-phosphate synthase